jgi:hypothetical protein
MTSRPSGLQLAVLSLVILAFTAGAAAGVVGDRMMSPRIRLRATVGDMSSVLDRLQLSTEQRRQAEAIVARSAPRSEAVMLELGSRLRAVADSVDTELRAILTAEQRLRLDSLKRDSRLLLRRKVIGPDGVRTDTVIDTVLPPPRR